MTALYKWVIPAKGKQSFRDELMEVICHEFKVTKEDVTGKRSFHHLVDARSIYAFLCREYLHDTYMRIGIDLGNRSHATVINLLQRLKDLVYVNDKIAVKLKKIEEEILNQSI